MTAKRSIFPTCWFKLFFVMLLMASALPAFSFDYYDEGKCSRPFYLNNVGVKHVEILYEYNFWGGRQDRKIYPETEKIISALQRVATDLVVIDIEIWDSGKDYSEDVFNNYLVLASDIRKIRKDIQFGFYGVLPKRGFYEAISELNTPKRKNWIDSNDARKPLAAAVDVLFPSLYTFYPDRARWITFAENQLKEAKRLAGNKKVIAFVWPRYHESNRILGGRYIGKEFFFAQLSFLQSHADGVIVWDKSDDCDLSERWRKDLYHYLICGKSEATEACLRSSTN